MKWTDELVDLLLMEVPAHKRRKEGFLDILDVPYHENSITRIYSYFLDAERNRQIAAMFLDALLDLVKTRSGKNLEFGNHFCQIEYNTAKGNRIDLLIKTGGDECELSDHAIIIENKIFSPVRNDLRDYWDSIVVKEQNKVGILLTLYPSKIPAGLQHQFVNVTHNEWMKEVKSRGIPCDLEPELYVYLNDFIRNMENIAKDANSISEDAKFFFEHSGKILRAKQTYDAARSHILGHLQIVSEKLRMNLYGNSQGWRHIWDYKSHVYYVISIEETLSADPHIIIYLEIYKDALLKEADIRKLFTEMSVYTKLHDDRLSNKSWAHLCYKRYPLNRTELEHLADRVHEIILDDFLVPYELVSNYLKADVKH
jgi:hypothetical protein